MKLRYIIAPSTYPRWEKLSGVEIPIDMEIAVIRPIVGLDSVRGKLETPLLHVQQVVVE